jgi:excisionase family DNA binding protein
LTQESSHRETSSVTTHTLLTVRELADELRVPVATVYRWNSDGTGPPVYRVGRHARFKRDEVDRWLEQQARPVG